MLMCMWDCVTVPVDCGCGGVVVLAVCLPVFVVCLVVILCAFVCFWSFCIVLLVFLCVFVCVSLFFVYVCVFVLE